jgi:hypothetical protein
MVSCTYPSRNPARLPRIDQLHGWLRGGDLGQVVRALDLRVHQTGFDTLSLDASFVLSESWPEPRRPP